MIKSITCKLCNRQGQHKGFGLCNSCYYKEYHLKNKVKRNLTSKNHYVNNKDIVKNRMKETFWSSEHSSTEKVIAYFFISFVLYLFSILIYHMEMIK